MLTTFVATSVPTVDRLEDILDDMEDECDVITLLESARKFGKFRESEKIPGKKIPGTMTF